MITPKKRLKRNESSESTIEKTPSIEEVQNTAERRLHDIEKELFQAQVVINKLKRENKDLCQQIEHEKKVGIDIRKMMEDQKADVGKPLETTEKQKLELEKASCSKTTSLSSRKDPSSINKHTEKVNLTQKQSQVEYFKKIAIIEKERDKLIKSSQKQEEKHKKSITEYEKKLLDVEKALSESVNTLCDQLSATMEILSKFDQQQKVIDSIESTINDQNVDPPSTTTSNFKKNFKYYLWIFFVFNVIQASIFSFLHPNEFIVQPTVSIFHKIANRLYPNV